MHLISRKYCKQFKIAFMSYSYKITWAYRSLDSFIHLHANAIQVALTIDAFDALVRNESRCDFPP